MTKQLNVEKLSVNGKLTGESDLMLVYITVKASRIRTRGDIDLIYQTIHEGQLSASQIID